MNQPTKILLIEDDINVQVGDPDDIWLSAGAAAKKRANTGQQLGKRERLDHVIVRSELQSFHPVVNRICAVK